MFNNKCIYYSGPGGVRRGNIWTSGTDSLKDYGFCSGFASSNRLSEPGKSFVGNISALKLPINTTTVVEIPDLIDASTVSSYGSVIKNGRNYGIDTIIKPDIKKFSSFTTLSYLPADTKQLISSNSESDKYFEYISDNSGPENYFSNTYKCKLHPFAPFRIKGTFFVRDYQFSMPNKIVYPDCIAYEEQLNTDLLAIGFPSKSSFNGSSYDSNMNNNNYYNYNFEVGNYTNNEVIGYPLPSGSASSTANSFLKERRSLNRAENGTAFIANTMITPPYIGDVSGSNYYLGFGYSKNTTEETYKTPIPFMQGFNCYTPILKDKTDSLYTKQPYIVGYGTDNNSNKNISRSQTPIEISYLWNTYTYNEWDNSIPSSDTTISSTGINSVLKPSLSPRFNKGDKYLMNIAPSTAIYKCAHNSYGCYGRFIYEGFIGSISWFEIK